MSHRTIVTRDQLYAIVEEYFETRGASVNWMMWDFDHETGALDGAIVDNSGPVIELPAHTEDFA